ncbi:MAG: metalloregulator ArsR/SmtB family transcription factor [Clostridia bacterium]|nr:metalloregulator ArsR/SmtB family transcription factor [Clostridia bacterium]
MKSVSNDTCKVECIHKDKIEKVRASIPDKNTLYHVSELFKVFGDATRTNILSALFINELCVCDLAKLLDMTISAVSHQLRVLRHSRLVKFRKQGKEVIYMLDDDHVGKILDMAIEHIKE